MKLTAKQRETLGKAFLNTSNAILVAWVLGSLAGHAFRPDLVIAGVCLYFFMIFLALWVDR